MNRAERGSFCSVTRIRAGEEEEEEEEIERFETTAAPNRLG